MKSIENLKNKILAASGEKQATLVLKNAKVINVFTEEIEETDIAIEAGYIVGLGTYRGINEIEMNGRYVCPGFLDGHIHLESSMVSPNEFEKTVVPHGTTAVVTDPHEIANVAGVDGIRYMLQETEDLELDVYFMLPSCVPATKLDESGAVLEAEQLRPFYQEKRVLGLAELMNSYGTVRGEHDILQKVEDALEYGKQIDGHGPSLQGKNLNAYITAGVKSDHECSYMEEAAEKIRRGQWVMIREGTAAKNLRALIPLFSSPYYHRAILVTDDKHPEDLIKYGHMDYIIREAIAQGADPIHAIKMATLNPALYFGLATQGAIAPGYKADLVVIDDLRSFVVNEVYINGKIVAKQGCYINKSVIKPQKKEYERVTNSFHMKKIQPELLQMAELKSKQRVIQLTPYSILTSEKIITLTTGQGMSQQEVAAGVDVKQDIIKLAVLERHHNTGNVGVGYISGYGLKRGAVASSVSHDSHNLIIAGTNDLDMALAGNAVRSNGGGLAIAVDGKVLSELPLPIAGLMTNKSVLEVEEILQIMKQQLRDMGIPEEVDPFMTLAFVSLPVIPKLRLNTFGLIDVETQTVVPTSFD